MLLWCSYFSDFSRQASCVPSPWGMRFHDCVAGVLVGRRGCRIFFYNRQNNNKTFKNLFSLLTNANAIPSVQSMTNSGRKRIDPARMSIANQQSSTAECTHCILHAGRSQQDCRAGLRSVYLLWTCGLCKYLIQCCRTCGRVNKTIVTYLCSSYSRELNDILNELFHWKICRGLTVWGHVGTETKYVR